MTFLKNHQNHFYTIIGTLSNYDNYGSEIIDPFTQDVIDERDCYVFNKHLSSTNNVSYYCGGDCANFVSQCLIAGGLNSKILTEGATNVVNNKNGEFTIVGALALRDQLKKLGALFKTL